MDDALVRTGIFSNKIDPETQKRFVREAKWTVREEQEQQISSNEEPSSKKGARLSPKSQTKVMRLAAKRTVEHRSDKMRHADVLGMDQLMALLKQSRESEEVVKPKQKLVEQE